ncbi:phosphatidylglycerol lysyltransferase domain-containing protein [Loktanella agnita]|uniref:phosphatidylglycerol lysyltransferase domain-containing protein n=1 Tax=Loktanella agnita TaxID=287097 RepID=UPI00398868D1
MFQLRPELSGSFPKTLVQFGLPIGALVLFGGLLWRELAAMDLAAIGVALGQVSTASWIIAACATWFSFLALGRYDAIWHEVLRTGVSQPAARRAGIRAVAIAQMVGFGAVTASLVRWRCLPTLSLWQATRLSAAVTLTFTACWFPFALIALWWVGADALPVSLSLPWLTTLLLGTVVLLALGWRRFVPQMQATHLARLMVWTGIDMSCAALALYVLLPAGTNVPFDIIIAAYVIALGLGLISNSPGGTGAFDLTLLALIPMLAPEQVVGTIIAFRIVYYLAPALLALASIARPTRPTARPAQAPAHWGLIAQTGELRDVADQPYFIGDAPGIMCAIGPQMQSAPQVSDINNFWRESLTRGRVPAFYNCASRHALAARKAGWYVRRTAMEAMIQPATWTTSGGKRQTLRRKLRQAEQAGVTVTQTTDLSMAALRDIAAEWAIAHGGEYGFSMGRFAPDLIAQQRVFLIKQDNRIIGFISFHTSRAEWTLDLIRHVAGLPDGTMHAAIVAAISQARAEGVARLSLAAVPDPRHTPAFWAEKRAGLIQFKRSFCPIWVGRYHAAPNKLTFWFTGVVIGIAVHRPLANLSWKLAARVKPGL